MGEREEYVVNEVIDIYGKCLSQQMSFKEGRKHIYKIYAKDYDRFENMNSKYIVLYKLIYCEYMEKNPIAVYNYILQLKNDMDNTINYKEEYTGDYCNMLSVYCDCEEIKLSKQDKLEYYDYIHNYYKRTYERSENIYDYIRMINIQFNMERINENFNQLLVIIEEIHSIDDSRAKSTLSQMLLEIKILNKDLYNKALTMIETNN